MAGLPEGMTITNGRLVDGAMVFDLTITDDALIEKLVEALPEGESKAAMRDLMRRSLDVAR